MMDKKSRYSVSLSDDHEIDHFSSSESQGASEYVGFDFDRRWFNVMWLMISVVLITLGVRVFYVSVLQHEEYAFVASGNTIRETPIIAPRGRIFASGGEVLAENEPNYRLLLSYKYMQEDVEAYRGHAPFMARTFGFSEAYFVGALEQARKEQKDIVLKEQLSQRENVTFESHGEKVPGIYIEKNASRKYYDGMLFSHIIGYEGLIQESDYIAQSNYLLTDRIGKTGLEYQYEDDLRGLHGVEKQLVDSRGRSVRTYHITGAVTGKDLYTHLDADLQRMLTYRLEEEFERAETTRGAAVALDPRTGAVRAMVSIPSYDNNAFVHGIDGELYSALVQDEDRPLFNRVVHGVYPPGSTVKPVMGVATLMEEVVGEHRQIESRGGLQLGKFFFGDWKAHGFTDLRRAIAVSSDVYFYTVAGGYGDVRGMGIDAMKKWMTQFGYGHEAGIDLPGEVPGLYPDESWKEKVIGERWYIGDTYNTSIGQGFVTSTPLQVANSIAAIANGGTLYEPRIVDYVIDEYGQVEKIEPHVVRTHLAPPNVIAVAQEGMRQTITEGTAQMLKDAPVEIAGKTGTAQFGIEEKVHSWFVSYAPYDNPELVLLVMVEGQTPDVSTSTVPVAKDVLEWYFDGRDPQSPWLVPKSERKEAKKDAIVEE